MALVGLEHASIQPLRLRQPALRVAGEGLFERLERRPARFWCSRRSSLAHAGVLVEENGRERASNRICLTRGKKSGKVAPLRFSAVAPRSLRPRRAPNNAVTRERPCIAFNRKTAPRSAIFAVAMA